MPAAAEPDPYSVLGVERGATAAELRAAYRELGAKYHPDRHQGNPLEDLASARMAEINRAYEILSDPKRRAAYDAGFGGGGGGGRSGGEGAGAGFPFSSGGGAGAGGPRRANRRVAQVVALVLLLPIVIRFGAFIVRALEGIVRGLFEAAEALRGTPAAGVAVLLALVALVLVLLRRRHRARGKTP
jgi:curved DNA-binding protein CbpA